MSESMEVPQSTDAGPAEGAALGGDTGTGDAEAGGSQQTFDPNDFEARLRNDPEFAVAEFKKQQSAASKANDRLRRAQLAIQIAEQLGGGDVERGANIALQELVKFRQLRENPKALALIERTLNGEPIADVGYEASEDDDDPIQKQLSQVYGTQARLESEMGQWRFERALTNFRETTIGKMLTPDQFDEFLQHARPSIETWASTPEGRKRLSNFGVNDVRALVVNWLASDETRFREVGRRMARSEAEQLKQRETDGPFRSTSIGPDKPPENLSIMDAWRLAGERARGR